MDKFTKMFPCQPHAAFAGFARSLQHKWVYLHIVTDISPKEFYGFEEAIMIKLPNYLWCKLSPGKYTLNIFSAYQTRRHWGPGSQEGGGP